MCCVFLFSSKGDDQGEVPEHLGETQEVTSVFYFSLFSGSKT